MTRIRFTRTTTTEHSVDIPLPAEVQAELDAGQTLQSMSDDAKAELYYELSVPPHEYPNDTVEILVTGGDLPLGNVTAVTL